MFSRSEERRAEDASGHNTQMGREEQTTQHMGIEGEKILELVG